MDATLTAWWILYVEIRDSGDNEIMLLFNMEHQKIIAVFKKLYEGEKTNIETKLEFRELFNGIKTKEYINRSTICTTTIHDYINESLYEIIENINNTHSTFHMSYKVGGKCVPCNRRYCIHQSTNNTMDLGQLNKSVTSIQELIQIYFKEPHKKMTCMTCSTLLKIDINMTVMPNIIIVMMPTLEKSTKKFYNIKKLDNEITFNNITYDLFGAVYGDGVHFIFRYIYDNDVYEADGMQKHYLSDETTSRLSAESLYVTRDHDVGLSFILSTKRIGTKHKQATDIYYRKRQSTVQT